MPYADRTLDRTMIERIVYVRRNMKTDSIEIRLEETSQKGVFEVHVIGFGYPGLNVLAPDIKTAKTNIGEYIYNELSGKDDIE